jgi:Ca-activated chloride channel family protein
MDARDVEPRRLEAAQDAAYRFLDEVPEQVRVGLVSFAETAVANVAPTDDRNAVRGAIERLQLRPGTAIGEALLAAVDLIEADMAALQAETAEGDEPPATIVILSDGDTTAGRPNRLGVQAAEQSGIAVSTISFGTREGTIVFQGQLVPVPSNGRALRGVAVGVTTEQEEVLVPFMVAALILGTAAAIMSLWWFSRLP